MSLTMPSHGHVRQTWPQELVQGRVVVSIVHGSIPRRSLVAARPLAHIRVRRLEELQEQAEEVATLELGRYHAPVIGTAAPQHRRYLRHLPIQVVPMTPFSVFTELFSVVGCDQDNYVVTKIAARRVEQRAEVEIQVLELGYILRVGVCVRRWVESRALEVGV